MFFYPTFLFIVLYALFAEKIEAVIYSDHSLFDHNREMMKQAYLINYENISRPRRDNIPASALGAVYN
jgi:hypothetical protein